MSQLQFEKNVSLKEYSTFGIGGVAKEFCVISTIAEMQYALKTIFEEGKRHIIIGKGSNCLFDDKGFNGTVLLNKIQFIEWGEKEVHVGAGYSFSLLGTQSARKGLSGLEFASGIPGSVGGAVFMNAGAGKLETKDLLISVGFVFPDGNFVELEKDQMAFAYRTSIFQEVEGAIVSARFALQESKEAKTKQESLLEYRMETQPLKDKSCGCMFRNPEGGHAGKLIEEAGLKGLTQGGAEISPKHANFIVNREGASSQDVLDLIAYIQLKIAHKYQIQLETEVCYIPYDDEV